MNRVEFKGKQKYHAIPTRMTAEADTKGVWLVAVEARPGGDVTAIHLTRSQTLRLVKCLLCGLAGCDKQAEQLPPDKP